MMRKANREISNRNEIVEVMRRCDVCRVGLNDMDGYPYILPLNFGLIVDGEDITLVFHSALEGHKLDLIKRDSRASFEMDCKHELQYFEDKGYCTMAYESVMGKGRIRMLEGEEKLAALREIMEQYHPGEDAYFSPAAVPRTAVYCLQVDEISGKRKNPK